MQILIVDDEALARDRLCSMVRELYPAAAVAVAENGLHALALFDGASPDIVLLDVRMSGMDGLEFAQHIASMPAAPAVVFTTAYPEYALPSFDVDAVDYLLKPIRKERLQAALEKAILVCRARSRQRGDITGPQGRVYLNVLVHGNVERVAVHDIYYFKAEQKYVLIGRASGEVLTNESLKSLAQEFATQFIQVHRNALVAVRYVKSLQRCADGGYQVGFNGIAQEIQVSRRHLANVKRRLNIN